MSLNCSLKLINSVCKMLKVFLDIWLSFLLVFLGVINEQCEIFSGVYIEQIFI